MIERPEPASVEADAARVRTEYARRAADDRLRRYYRRVGPALARAAEDRQARILNVVDAVTPRLQARVLEVGCGRGEDLVALTRAGVPADRLAGVDLLVEDIEQAAKRLPGSRITVANGALLPFDDSAFDVTYQVVMLSSVVSPEVRARIAAEMVRVTRPGGRIVSYDMTAISDRNPHLVPIDTAELHRLFPGHRMTIERVSLYLPIASRVPWWAGSLLVRIPWLRRHLFAVLTRGTP
jgi:SAM-dependent methyltransferase